MTAKQPSTWKWLPAFAPSANIELISCSSGSFTFGGVLAIANLVNEPGPYPGVLSMSYGLCEAATGNGGNAYFYNAFQQAAAQGISAFASSGDAGTGQCGDIFTAGEDGYNVPAWPLPAGVSRLSTCRWAARISRTPTMRTIANQSEGGGRFR